VVGIFDENNKKSECSYGKSEVIAVVICSYHVVGVAPYELSDIGTGPSTLADQFHHYRTVM
jgi:hypothetical protein